MQTAEKSFAKFEEVVNQLKNNLNKYTEEQLIKKPDDQSWSVGQVYMHLVLSARFFNLKNIEQCKTSNSSGEKSLAGKIVFAIGMFLPIKVKVKINTEIPPAQPANKKDIEDKLDSTVVKVKAAISAVKSAPTDKKAAHSALGFLNALEWYQLIYMHYKHHLRQIARLNKFLGV